MSYEFDIHARDADLMVAVNHNLKNHSDTPVVVCNINEGLNVDWNTLPSRYDGSILSHDNFSTGHAGCIDNDEDEDFTTLEPGETISFPYSFPIHKDSKGLTYHATYTFWRNGKRLGHQAWSGDVSGSQVTIPTRIPNTGERSYLATNLHIVLYKPKEKSDQSGIVVDGKTSSLVDFEAILKTRLNDDPNLEVLIKTTSSAPQAITRQVKSICDKLKVSNVTMEDI